MKKLVNETLNDREIRPLTDLVSIKEPDIKEYNVDIKYYMEKSDESRSAEIGNNVNVAVQEWVDWQKAKLGRDINTDELIHRLKVAGVKRVTITNPVFTEIAENTIAVAKEPYIIKSEGTEQE